MIGVVLVGLVLFLVIDSEITRQRVAKRMAEMYRRDKEGRWE